MTNDVAFDLIEPDFASKLRVMPGFAALDNGGVRLEQTDQFERRRQFFAAWFQSQPH